MTTADEKLTRIGVFYDGNFFSHVSNFYNYSHHRQARLSIGGLHAFIRDQVAKEEGVDARFCQIVDAHYFRGRLPAHEAQNRQKLLAERQWDDVLMREGVVTHYLPVTMREGKVVGEKGIDVWFALEAFELAIYKRFNVSVLVACDSDYIPLIRKLNTLGTRVMLLGWDFSYVDDSGSTRTTTTSVGLLEEATYPILMHALIDDKTRRSDALISSLFLPQRPKEQKAAVQSKLAPESSASVIHAVENIPHSPRVAENLGLSRQDEGKPLCRGKIMVLKEGYGFISTPDKAQNVFFYWGDVDGDFHDLKVGDQVEFELGTNEKGLVAKQVKSTTTAQIT